MKSLQAVLLLLGVVLTQTEGLKSRCFANFNLVSGQCEVLLGVVEEDDCCQNPHHGFIDAAGVCQFCGPSVWTAWSPWSQCLNLCGPGVIQRTRTCHGLSECAGDQDVRQMKPCNSTACCPAAEWMEWGAWSSCSVSCGNLSGSKTSRRVCSHPTPGCEGTCLGPAVQTEPCFENQPCPVHGGWTRWSHWSVCSEECIEGPFREDGSGAYPIKSRIRTCSSPTPSSYTKPAGNTCLGQGQEFQPCRSLPNCPVNGQWGPWGPLGACSTPCGEGLALSVRLCDNPPPQYGGQYCIGHSTKTEDCTNVCPVHGSWTGWSTWADCSAPCHSSRDSTRTRHRSCSNPAPSYSPKGNNCAGQPTESKKCDEIPNCPVDGVWGPWSNYGGCSVTCGVGVRRSVRACDSPAPRYNGKQCLGSPSQTTVCITNIHCPVNGVWTDWTKWSDCLRTPACSKRAGTQMRNRTCLHRDFGGSICPEGPFTDRRGCYNIRKCKLPGEGWSDWSEWSLCRRVKEKMMSERERTCIPNVDDFNPVNHYTGDPIEFHGTPDPVCQRLAIAERRMSKECVNIPPSP